MLYNVNQKLLVFKTFNDFYYDDKTEQYQT